MDRKGADFLFFAYLCLAFACNLLSKFVSCGSSETHPFELVKSVHVLSAWWKHVLYLIYSLHQLWFRDFCPFWVFFPILEQATKFLDFASLFRDPTKPMDRSQLSYALKTEILLGID